MEEHVQQPESPDPLPPEVVCPDCGQGVDPSAISGPVVECPHCGSQFFPPVAEQFPDEEEGEQAKESREEELSSLRIKQLSTLRRTAYRTRSYLIIGTAGSAWLTIPIIIALVKSVRAQHHWGLWPSAYVMMALAALIGAYKFGVRALEVQRGINADLRARELEELEAARREPDLSALSDGSQYARALEQMHGMQKDEMQKDESSTKDTKGHEEGNA